MFTKIALIVAAAALQGARAQITSNATCFAQWANLYNSKGQSPCLVAAYLGGACNGGQYDVSALLPQQHYIGPTALLVNPCQCSTVMYSMMGACSVCQNATLISWTSWSAECTQVYVDVFPDNIPAGTAVPGYAFENVTVADTFNPQNALQDHSPESTASNNQVTQTAVGGGSPTSTITGSNGGSNSGKKSSNTGAIAGGVVGGVVGLALVALIAFLLIRRSKNKSRAASNGPISFGAAPGGSPLISEKVADPGFTPVPYAPTPQSPPAHHFSMQQQPQKLYDPNDPSTFPTSPAPMTLDSQYTGNGPTLVNYGGAAPQVPGNNYGAYRGVAEV